MSGSPPNPNSGRQHTPPFHSSPPQQQQQQQQEEQEERDAAHAKSTSALPGGAPTPPFSINSPLRHAPGGGGGGVNRRKVSNSGSIRGGPMRADITNGGANSSNGVPRGGSVRRISARSTGGGRTSHVSATGGGGISSPLAVGSPTARGDAGGVDGGGRNNPSSASDSHSSPGTSSPQARRASFVDLAETDSPPRMVRGHSGYLAQPRGAAGVAAGGFGDAFTVPSNGTAGVGSLLALTSPLKDPGAARSAAGHPASAPPRRGSNTVGGNYGGAARANALAPSLPSGGSNVGATPAGGFSMGAVYSVKLDGDSGGVEMDLARGALVEALHLRDRYHGALQPQQYPHTFAHNGSNGAQQPSQRLGSASGGPHALSRPATSAPAPSSVPQSQQQQPQPAFSMATVNLRMDDGVFVFGDLRTPTAAPAVPWETFYDDFQSLRSVVEQPVCQSACRYRLEVLEEKFCAYKLSNSDIEVRDVGNPGGGGSSASGAGTVAGGAGAGRRLHVGGNVGRGGGGVMGGSGSHGSAGGGVFSGCCKVDNGVLLECMPSPQGLVDFIQETVEVRGEEDVVAIVRGGGGGGLAGGRGDAGESPQEAAGTGPLASREDGGGGEPVTLRRFCELVGFRDARHLTVDALGLQPSGDRPTPFYDPLDPNQNQVGPHAAALLRLFLSKDTLNRGDYLAQLVRPCLARNEHRTRTPQATEAIIEITGLLPDEWGRTALWLKAKQLLGDAGGGGNTYRHNRFVVSFPRRRIAAMAAAARDGGGNGLYGGDMDTGSRPGGGFLASDLGSGGSMADMVAGAGAGGGSSSNSSAFLAAAFTGAATPTTFEHHQQHIDSLFLPLFLATIAPEDPHNGAVADFLAHVGAIVVVPLENNFGATDIGGASSDAGGGHRLNERKRTRPADIPWTETVSDMYFMYYVWANLCSLNALRRLRGLNTLQLRSFIASDGVSGSGGTGSSGATVQPYGNELAGGGGHEQRPTSLLVSYLLADSVYNALGLSSVPVLQYLFSLTRIGVCMSPLSSNALGMCAYTDHPFSRFFRRGLRVSLGTVAPLLFHHSATDPLLEEFGTASKLYRMSGVDVCEVALNSVLMSSFPDTEGLHSYSHGAGTGGNRFGAATVDEATTGIPFTTAAGTNGVLPPATTTTTATSTGFHADVATKAAWLGETFVRDGWRGNAYALTNVPTTRLAMREDLWAAEMDVVHGRALRAKAGAAPRLASHAGSASAAAAGEGGATGSSGSATAAAVAPAPYLVTDPRTSFPRVAFVGPYHRETQHAVAAQHLHRALELRRMYVQSPHRSSTTASSSAAATATAGGGIHSALASAVATAVAATSPSATPALDGKGRADVLGVLANLGTDAQVGNLSEYLAYLVELYRASGAGCTGAAPLAPGASAGDLSLAQQRLHNWGGIESAFGRRPPPSPQNGAASAAAAAAAAAAYGGQGGKGKVVGSGSHSPATGVVGDEDDEDDFDEAEWMYKTVEGVVVPHEVHQIPRLPQDMFHYDDFCAHVEEIRAMADDGRLRSFAARRLRLLENRFMLHTAVNHSLEAGSTADKASQNRDFYQSTKVDCTVRMEAGMPARLLLDFIIDKAKNSGDDIVSHEREREPQTLRQLLKELNISPQTLTVDDLEVQVDPTLDWGRGGVSLDAVPSHHHHHNHRRHNSQSRAEDGDCTDDNDDNADTDADEGRARARHSRRRGRDVLLSLLLRTNNQMNGRYFAELTKRTFENLARDRFTFTESRLRVYGTSSEEWAQLSTWFDTHGMGSARNQWMVEVPRSYGHWRQQGKVRHFAEFLENIFTPLWAVSLHPSRDPRLFHFLNHISAFDCVAATTATIGGTAGGSDGKGSMGQQPLSSLPPPHEWTYDEDPPFNYYMYHLWANITSLNAFRRRRKFSQFGFRPSCGESGPVDELIGGFLLANSITYGVELKSSAVLQYLYYLARIGVVMCPLSNNSSVASAAGMASSRSSTLQQNPFPLFFKRGLCVTLGTDCPLKYHHTQEPLVEEYSIASKMWKLSPTDMCEIARTSVLMSGFSPLFKMQQLGELFFLSSSAGNCTTKTHLSSVRVGYRFEAYHCEVGYLEYITGQVLPKAMLTLEEEETVLAVLNGVRAHSTEEGRRRLQQQQQRGGGSGGEAWEEAGIATKCVGFASDDGTNNNNNDPSLLPGRGGDRHLVGGNIIDATPDAAEVQRLQARRALMRKQVEELTETVSRLQKRNQQLTAKLYEEKERDQQAALLRRQHLEGRLTMASAKATYGEQVYRMFGDGVGVGQSLEMGGQRGLPLLPAADGVADVAVADTSERRSTSGNSTVLGNEDSSSSTSRPGKASEALLASVSSSAAPTVALTGLSQSGGTTSLPNPGALLSHTESLWSRATYPSASPSPGDMMGPGSGVVDGGLRQTEPPTRLPSIPMHRSGALK